MYKQTTCFGYKKRNIFSLILLCILFGVQSPFIKLIVEQDNRLSEAVGSENNFIRLSWNAFIQSSRDKNVFCIIRNSILENANIRCSKKKFIIFEWKNIINDEDNLI